MSSPCSASRSSASASACSPWLGIAAVGTVLLVVGITGALGELRTARTSTQLQKGA